MTASSEQLREVGVYMHERKTICVCVCAPHKEMEVMEKKKMQREEKANLQKKQEKVRWGSKRINEKCLRGFSY